MIRKTPVYAKACPLPYAIKEKVKDELSNMVKQNIISPITHSNWAAPIVPIQKTSGGFRIYGDFKVTVNKPHTRYHGYMTYMLNSQEELYFLY